MDGVGGTKGGIAEFFAGVVMMFLSMYMLLDSVLSQAYIGVGIKLYTIQIMGKYYSITSGMIFMPMIFGAGMVFSNGKNWIGWVLLIGSFFVLLLGVMIRFNFSLRYISWFELTVILILSVVGLGLFIRSFRAH